MKRLLFVVVMVMFFFNLFAQKNTSGGKIKSMVVYEQNFEKGQTKAVKESEVKYDAKGNAIEEIEYKDGKKNKHTTFQYDAKNNKTKETEMNSSGKTVKVIEYKYSGDRKVEKTVYDENNKIKSKKTYQYENY
jgi:hypothetical protein